MEWEMEELQKISKIQPDLVESAQIRIEKRFANVFQSPLHTYLRPN